VNRDPIENLLSDLGEARSAGVFPAEGQAAPAAFPWQARPASAGVRGVRWLRVAVPLAAAATLAFAFVGSGFRRHAATEPKSIPTALVTADADDCNGDGRVNGEDIDCFVRQHTAGKGASELQTEAFTRRLLGI
jgi:hypothetical protein